MSGLCLRRGHQDPRPFSHLPASCPPGRKPLSPCVLLPWWTVPTLVHSKGQETLAEATCRDILWLKHVFQAQETKLRTPQETSQTWKALRTPSAVTQTETTVVTSVRGHSFQACNFWGHSFQGCSFRGAASVSDPSNPLVHQARLWGRCCL